jgi:hypothetical protein
LVTAVCVAALACAGELYRPERHIRSLLLRPEQRAPRLDT